MSYLEEQIKQIIKNNVPKTISLDLPIKNNFEKDNLLLQILKNQEEINERIKSIYIKISRLETSINCLPYGNKYSKINWH